MTRLCCRYNNRSASLSRAGAPCHEQQSANQALNVGAAVPTAESTRGGTRFVLGQGPGTGGRGHASAGAGTCVVLPAPSWPSPHFQSPSPARREVGWQGPWGSTAPQVIGSLAAPCALAPLLSQVYRTQIQRYQRATAAGTGPAGCDQPLLSPSLTRSSGWKRFWLCCAARFFLGITADRHRRQRAGCRAGAGWGAQRGHGVGHGQAGWWVLLPPAARGASPGARLVRGQL